MRHHRDQEPGPPRLRRFNTTRAARKWIVAAMVFGVALLVAGISAAFHQDNLYLAGLMKHSTTVSATVLSQDVDDCSVQVKLNGGEHTAQTGCTDQLFKPGSEVQLVADPRMPAADPYYYHLYSSPRQLEEDAETDWMLGAFFAILLAGTAWVVGYQFMLKPDRAAHVIRQLGVKPPPGRFERMVLALQHAPRKVRYTLLLMCLVMSIASAAAFIVGGAQDAHVAHEAVSTQPHITASLAAHEITGRSGEPAKVDVDDRRMTLSWNTVGQKSMQLGDELLVVIDPRYQDIAIPVDFAQGPDNSSGARLGNVLFAFFPGALLMGVAFRVLASRSPFSAFEPVYLDEEPQTGPL